MTCHAQAAELLAPHVAPGDTLLDASCGSGYFFHSLAYHWSWVFALVPMLLMGDAKEVV